MAVYQAVACLKLTTAMFALQTVAAVCQFETVREAVDTSVTIFQSGIQMARIGESNAGDLRRQ